MTTTRLLIPEHLKEYLTGRFGDFNQAVPVRIPNEFDLYHIIFDLLEKRPANCMVDRGNLELVLPERNLGKRPENYNYLGSLSQQIITQKIELMMWAEVHDFMDEQKHRYGIDYKDSVHVFILKYGIESLSEDAFLKNYYRWRGKVRRREKKRAYSHK